MPFWKRKYIFGMLLKELGNFHYINCVGVLHHLPQPQEGLKTLTNLLTPDGGISLMVVSLFLFLFSHFFFLQRVESHFLIIFERKSLFSSFFLLFFFHFHLFKSVRIHWTYRYVSRTKDGTNTKSC